MQTICPSCQGMYIARLHRPFAELNELAMEQNRYIRFHFGRSLCPDCIRIVRDTYSVISVNPLFKYDKT